MNLEHAQTAMKIILHAGDAREKTMDALKALDTFDIENAKELLEMPNIDGGLIGGASLKAASFAKIVNS